MKVTIDVTGEDIAAGQRANCWECPIARAATRALVLSGTDSIVGAAPSALMLWRERDGLREPLCDTPEVARKWMAAFDAARGSLPLAFEVDIDDALMALIGQAATETH